MDEEGALDAHFMRDATHGEALARPATSPAKDDSLEDLRPLAVAFLYLDRDPDRVSGAKVVYFGVSRDRREVMGFHCRFILKGIECCLTGGQVAER